MEVEPDASSLKDFGAVLILREMLYGASFGVGGVRLAATTLNIMPVRGGRRKRKNTEPLALEPVVTQGGAAALRFPAAQVASWVQFLSWNENSGMGTGVEAVATYAELASVRTVMAEESFREARCLARA